VAYVGNKGSRLQSSLNPVNVLNPFDPAVQALEAPITPVPAACFGAHSSSLDCSYTPELNAKFTSDNQVLFGVSAPYAGG